MTITWEAPAGGLWALDTLHLPGAVPRLFQERTPEAMERGFRPASRRYGLPIDYLEFRFVNDHCYARMRAVGAPDPKPGKETSPPPDVVLWLLARLHPELRRRNRAAKAALAERRWHDDLARWEGELKGDMLATGRALQAEDVTAMSDDELIDHVGRVADHMVRGMEMHFDLIAVHNIPLGRLVALHAPPRHRRRRRPRPPGGELTGLDRVGRGAGARSRGPAGPPASTRSRSTTCAPPAPRPAPPSTTTWPTTPGG